ncbi:MAG: NADP(H)-dependent aldo-keto reductase [Pseudomonadota bacterium]
MHYRQLGDSDVQVSVICLGTMTFGEQNTQAQAHQQLDHAVENGVNFIDTAEMYAIPVRAETQGLTEQYIGTWLGKRADRDKLIVATKVAGPNPNMTHLRGGPKLIADHIHQAIDASLHRLQTDYVDLYQVHWPARSTNYFGKLGYEHNGEEHAETIESTLSTLTELVRAGKIRHIGVSNETPWGVAQYLRLAETHGYARIVSIQNPYNLLNRSFEVGLAEFAHRDDVGLMAYSPLGFGALSGKYLDGQQPEGARLTRWSDYFPRYITDLAKKVTQQYVEIARNAGLDPAQMALAYVNSRRFVTANIIGATTLKQLEMNIASANISLANDVLEAIESVHLSQPNPCP